MKKSPFYGGEEREGSPRAKKSNLSPATRICFERETIVHTHSSNFREVVHQLTGAESSSNDERSPPLFINGSSRHENVPPNNGFSRDVVSSGNINSSTSNIHNSIKAHSFGSSRLENMVSNDGLGRDVSTANRYSFGPSRHDNGANNDGLGRDVSTVNSIKGHSFGSSRLENAVNNMANNDDGLIKDHSLGSCLQENAANNDGFGQDVVGSSSHEMHAKSDTPAPGKTLELEAKGPLALRLFERRRSSNNNKSFGRLSTNSKDLPALVSGPLTPLACEFEKICFSQTPIGSPDNHHHPKPISSEEEERGNNDMLMLSSTHPTGMDISLSVTRVVNMQPDMDSNHNNQLSAEDVAIAEKGFFLHSERPRSSELTLLPLFPESPRNI